MAAAVKYMSDDSSSATYSALYIIRKNPRG
jgi:hypothetical protein